MLYTTSYILLRVALHLYLYCRKAFGEYFDIQTGGDYEMKHKNYYISVLIDF